MVKKILPDSAPLPSAENRILAAARAEFIAQGLRGARMQAIAKRAGVNHALLHYYFRSKEKLFASAMREVFQTVWSAISGEMDCLNAKADLESTVAALLKAHGRVLIQHPGLPLFIFREILLEAKMIPAFSEAKQAFQEIPKRLNKALADEIKVGRMKSDAPIHFWLNLAGMTVSTFIAPQVIPKMPWPGGRFKLTERFVVERAEIIARSLVQGLRIPGKKRA